MKDPELETFANTIALEGHWESTLRKHTCLLGWNSGLLTPKTLADNGTGSLIQTRSQRFLLTCAHVWKGFECYRKSNSDVRLWISLPSSDGFRSPSGALPLSNPSLISIDDSLDLATITFDQIGELANWRFFRFVGATRTPIRPHDLVCFLGFPGAALQEGSPHRILNYLYSAQGVHDTSHSRFVLHSEPGKLFHQDQLGQPSSPVRITGASGAPVFKIGCGFDLELAGIVSELSSNDFSGGQAQGYELSDGTIFVTKSQFVRPDGSIQS